MKFLAAAGCPIRRELFPDHAMVEMRQCDGAELNIQVIAIPDQKSMLVVQIYSVQDIM